MTRHLIALFLFAQTVPAFAGDCPAGRATHPPLTGLDRASLVAAYTASFRGLFHRDPTFTRGAGVDDGDYWISASDHYGEFSGNTCRAGWSAYWEHWLEFGHGGSPALGDEPARFQPGVAPPVPPNTTHDAPPTSSLDLLAIKGELEVALARLASIETSVLCG
jgi:hypothetical protein